MPDNGPGSNWLALVICGGAVGWVAGLSTSPVVQTILTSAMAATVTLGTVLSGLRSNETDGLGEAPRESNRAQDSKSDKPPEETPKPRKRGSGPRRSVQPWPLAWAFLGVALGATLGAKARTSEWLVPDADAFVQRWKSTGYSNEELSRRLFHSLYGPPDRHDEPAQKDAKKEPPSSNPTEEAPKEAQEEVGRDPSAAPSVTPEKKPGPRATEGQERVSQASWNKPGLYNKETVWCEEARNALPNELYGKMATGIEAAQRIAAELKKRNAPLDEYAKARDELCNQKRPK